MLSDPSWHWDVNEELQTIQERTCLQLIYYMYYEMRNRYLWAVKLVGVTTPFSERVRSAEVLESTVPLQEIYRAMAAHYRLHHDKYRGQRMIPLDGLDDETRQEREWVYYFKSEVDDLLRDERYVRAILAVVAYEKEPEGSVEQKHMLTLLKERYENRQCTYCRAGLIYPKPWGTPPLEAQSENRS